MTEHIEDSRDRLDAMDRDVRRFESTLLVEMGDCKRSGDGLEKRLSKLEGVCGKLDGVSDSILKIKEGTVHLDLYSLKNSSMNPLHFHMYTNRIHCVN